MMTKPHSRQDAVAAELHQAAIAAMPLQLLNYTSDISPEAAAALEAEARRQLGRLTSQPWREEEAHAVMGHALREAARVVGVDTDGLELRRAQVQPAPELDADLRSKPRTIQLNDARWKKLQALGPGWLERMLDALPPA